MLNFSDWLMREANFSFSSFLDRIENNLSKIYLKIKRKETFEMEDGSAQRLSGLAVKEGKSLLVYKVKFHSEKTWVQMIRSFIEDPDFDTKGSLRIILDDGNVTPTTKPISALSKTEDFGKAGDSAKNASISDTTWGKILSLKDFTPTLPGKAIELSWISRFNEKFSEILEDRNLECCDLKINEFTLKNVVGVMGASEKEKDPKADIVFVNKDKELIGFTSIKSGSGISGFHQWGGVSQLNHTEIKQFIKNLKRYLKTIKKDGVSEKTCVYSEITSKFLKEKVVWGNDFSKTHFGTNNVEYIIQGNPNLFFSSKHVELKANFIATRKTKNFLSDASPHRPVIAALFRDGRNDFGIKNTRVFAYPFGGRKMHIRLTKNGFFVEGSETITPYEK